MPEARTIRHRADVRVPIDLINRRLKAVNPRCLGMLGAEAPGPPAEDREDILSRDIQAAKA